MAAVKKVKKKTSAERSTEEAPKKPRVFAMSFASLYPLYVQKAEKKGRTKEEVDEVIAWLTGYQGALLQQAIDTKVDIETFFARAPRMNPNPTPARQGDETQSLLDDAFDRGEGLHRALQPIR